MKFLKMNEGLNNLTMSLNDSVNIDDIASKLNSVDWDFDKVNGRDRIHDIHPYPARFIPQIPRELIRLFHPGDDSLVLDPFCGSGTTLVEAIRAGKPAMGIDIHPLAILIAKAKTTPLKSLISKDAAIIVRDARSDNVPIPNIPRLNHWFLPDVQQAIANLVSYINKNQEPITCNCLKVALSRIIVRVSNQESDTRYAAIEKDVNAAQVYRLFLDSVGVIELAISEAYGGFFAPRVKCELIQRDILTVSPSDIGQDVGLVVTSPPYPNAYEYWLYHKYRMFWLGMDPLLVKEKEIGARPHYFKKHPATEADFQSQMSQVFWLLSKVMKPGALACFLVGRSILHGRTIDNCSLLRKAAAPHGFLHVASVKRKIKRTRKAFNPAISTINEEAIVLFRTGGTF